MNDLDLLRVHGPAPIPATTAVLDRSRAALRTGIRDEVERAGTAPVVPLRPRTGRRRAVGLGLAAATVALASLLAPSLTGSRESGAIALTRVQPLAFPFTPAEVPAGLAGPVFDRDGDLTTAQYRGAGGDLLSVVLPGSLDQWTVPATARHVDVRDRDAVLFRQADGAVVVAWTEQDGTVVGVSGRGSFGDARRVQAFAGSLAARPQRVRLPLTVAPRGWEPSAYKAGRTATFTARDGESLTVVLTDGSTRDLSGYGVASVRTVEVSGAPAWVGRQGDEGWVLVGRTPDGTGFSLQAPGRFTRAEVVEVADGVRHRG